MRSTLIAAACFLGVAAAAGPASAIECEGNYQIQGSGHRIATPYCQDSYLAIVARQYGMQTSAQRSARILQNPSERNAPAAWSATTTASSNLRARSHIPASLRPVIAAGHQRPKQPLVLGVHHPRRLHGSLSQSRLFAVCVNSDGRREVLGVDRPLGGCNLLDSFLRKVARRDPRPAAHWPESLVCHVSWGQRPPGSAAKRFTLAYIFAAVEPGTDNAFALVMPCADTPVMQTFLEQFSQTICPRRTCSHILDRAGWHGSTAPVIPPQHHVAPPPAYCPDLRLSRRIEPVERVWLYLKKRFLSHCLLDDYDAIVAAACNAWNRLATEAGRIKTRSYPWITKVNP